MELHAVWNRIDQLEKLVFSQAKEIETLKRIVSCNQRAFSPTPINNVNTFRGQNYSLANNNGSVYRPISTIRAKTVDRELTKVIFQPYPMNSIVHPSTAIPPFAANHQKQQHHQQPTGCKSNHQRDPLARLSIGQKSFFEAEEDHNHHQQQQNYRFANNRWSTGPLPMAKAVNSRLAEPEPDLDEDDELNDDRPGKRQSFVELKTSDFCNVKQTNPNEKFATFEAPKSKRRELNMNNNINDKEEDFYDPPHVYITFTKTNCPEYPVKYQKLQVEGDENKAAIKRQHNGHNDDKWISRFKRCQSSGQSVNNPFGTSQFVIPEKLANRLKNSPFG